MTQEQTKGENAIVMGTVERVYQPREGDPPSTPGSIIIKSDKLGDCKLPVWQLFDINGTRTTEMPMLWQEIDPDWIIGQRIIAACKFESDWLNPTTGMVQHQYSKLVSLEYVDGEPPAPVQTTQVAPAVAPTTTPSTTPTSTPNEITPQKRDMYWSGSLNNAAVILSAKSDVMERAGEDIVDIIRKTALPFYVSRLLQPTEDEIASILGTIEDDPTNEEILFEATDLGAGATGEI